MASRWFVVPAVARETTDSDGNVISSATAPKYYDTSGIEKYQSAGVVNFDQYPGPISGDNYVVKFYGTTAALDTIESNKDAYTRRGNAVSQSDIAKWLNDKQGKDWTFEKWTDKL